VAIFNVYLPFLRSDIFGSTTPPLCGKSVQTQKIEDGFMLHELPFAGMLALVKGWGYTTRLAQMKD
jgi:hypothetical protein